VADVAKIGTYLKYVSEIQLRGYLEDIVDIKYIDSSYI